MTARDDLQAAWEQWDQAPGSHTTTNRMENAVQAAAHELGTPPTELRHALAAGRRAGRTRDEILDDLWNRKANRK